MPIRIDLDDVQGFIHHPYRYPLVRYLLYKVPNSDSGRQFLTFLTPLVTHAAIALDPRLETLLNVGITFQGLLALGVARDVATHFPADFKEEPNPVVMGDFGQNVPAFWWSRKFSTSDIHLIVYLFARTQDALKNLSSKVRSAADGLVELCPTHSGDAIDAGAISDVPGELHFGYRDGISQPDVRWGDDLAEPGTVDFRHFLLGYSTPSIQSSPTKGSSLSSAEAEKLARNGSYAVFRWIYQDVAKFNKFLADEGPRTFPELSEPDAQEKLAAKMLGRWRNGSPLLKSPDRPDASTANSNDFSYANDPEGLRCPFSAHVRVTNPRDQQLGTVEVVLGGVPRVIRRGAPWGPKLKGSIDDGVDRGLVGMFLCASIHTQFYKLTAWMKQNSFSPVFKDLRAQDFLASRTVPDASNIFNIPDDSGNRQIALPDFLQTRGTAFFLIPSLSGIRTLACGQENSR
jgi:Dyp-type peroxidase family